MTLTILADLLARIPDKPGVDSGRIAKSLGLTPPPELVSLCSRLGQVVVLAASDPEYPYLQVMRPDEVPDAPTEALEPHELEPAGLTVGTPVAVVAWLGADPSDGEIWVWHDGRTLRHAARMLFDLYPLEATDTATVLNDVLTGREPFTGHWRALGEPTTFTLEPRDAYA